MGRQQYQLDLDTINNIPKETVSVCSKQIMLNDDSTSNGGSEEKVAKSRGASEGDGGGRHQHLGRVQREQNQTGDIYLYLMHTLVYIYMGSRKACSTLRAE